MVRNLSDLPWQCLLAAVGVQVSTAAPLGAVLPHTSREERSQCCSAGELG